MNNSFGTEILLAEEKFKKKVHKVFPLEGKLILGFHQSVIKTKNRNHSMN